MSDSLGVNGPSTNQEIPSSIIIVGLGVFGVSTALALSHRPQWSKTHITVIEASPDLPNLAGSSVDQSRIVRPDYGNIAYAELALEAQRRWRVTSGGGWGADGRYKQSGLALIALKGQGEYVQKSLDNVRALAGRFPDMGRIEVLDNPEQVESVTGGMLRGDWGYVNWGSGWADARASVAYAISRLDKNRVEMKMGEVMKLIEDCSRGEEESRSAIVGVQLASGEKIHADMVVLATGAWTNKLIDLRGKIEATGQPLAYLDLIDGKEAIVKDKPVVLDLSSGLYVIPQSEKVLKIGRHSHGYSNPRKPNWESGGEDVKVSLPPEKWVDLPEEAQQAFRRGLKHSFPDVEYRKFSGRRVCWYADTPHTNFLIDFHPSHSGLFLATGGSGHGFKFLPVIGDKIADALEGRLDAAFKELWKWPPPSEEGEVSWKTGADVSRGGPKGMVLGAELAKGQEAQQPSG